MPSSGLCHWPKCTPIQAQGRAWRVPLQRRSRRSAAGTTPDVNIFWFCAHILRQELRPTYSVRRRATMASNRAGERNSRGDTFWGLSLLGQSQQHPTASDSSAYRIRPMRRSAESASSMIFIIGRKPDPASPFSTCLARCPASVGKVTSQTPMQESPLTADMVLSYRAR